MIIIQYCILLAMMICIFYISYMPSTSSKNREVLHNCIAIEIKIIFRKSRLVNELSKPSDFVKIDSPECVKTNGLFNGKKSLFEIFYAYQCTQIFRLISKNLYKAKINWYNCFILHKTIWCLGTKASKQHLENGPEISGSHIPRFDSHILSHFMDVGSKCLICPFSSPFL